jgi:hypothetical protein
MPKQGFRVVSLKETVIELLMERYKRECETKVVPFATWLSSYLLEKLEEDELLSRYAPGLELIGVEYDTAFIKDWFIDRIVEVVISDEGVGKRFLYCRYCERDDCLHVGFCFAVREINKVLVERGFKQPKVRKGG